jgi:hypothetical protein
LSLHQQNHTIPQQNHYISSDKTFVEMNDEIVLLQRKHLKSIKYTGTPENIKEIDELVSSWDYKEVVCKRQSRDSVPSFNHLFYKKSNFSPISYIEYNDSVEEWYQFVYFFNILRCPSIFYAL